MKIISTRVHGLLDYTVSLFLVASPWLLGFFRGGFETWVPFTLGFSTIGYSLFTRYEYGIVNSITMRTHLWLDTLSATVLIFSPWIFGFASTVYLPHVIIGIVEVAVILLSTPYTSYQVNHNAM